MPNAEKSYFRLNKGLNTEASLLNFPDGYTVDEQNYELFVDGSRRRRKGIDVEAGGAPVPMVPTTASTGAYCVFRWQNAGGIPQNDYVVIQTGYILKFFLDTDPVSVNDVDATIDLDTFRRPLSTTQDVESSMVEISYGRGHMFVVGKHIFPFYVKLDTTTTPYDLEPIRIDIRERDLEGVDDGYAVTAQPVDALSTHLYNLSNRGWTSAQITAFFASQAKYPSKAMIPWLGLRRALTASNAYDDDGVRTFSPDKLVAELFQDATAPIGHNIRDPFDTTTIQVTTGVNPFAISTWSISGTTAGAQTITITTALPHGLAPAAPIFISGQSAQFNKALGRVRVVTEFTFNGDAVIVATPAANQLTISVTFPSGFVGWKNQFKSYGTVYGTAISNPFGVQCPYGPKAVAFFAGRVWFAGTDYDKLSTKIWYSQIIESDAQYGKCYQQADPTDERVPDLVATDGGFIVIPEISNVLKMIPYGNSLLIYAYNGVWQIGGGEKGFFAADGYSIRKITDIGCVAQKSVVVAENIPFYWGISDIYAIAQDVRSGFLFAQNISLDSVTTLYNRIGFNYKFNCQGAYDEQSKKIVWLHSQTDAGADFANFNYQRALCFDVRLKAFIKYKFSAFSGHSIRSLFVVTPFPTVTPKLKLVVAEGAGANLVISTFNRTDYEDWGNVDAEAYLLAGYDSLGDPLGRQNAPYIGVFSKKTETGYAADTPINTSSTLVQARWDWADQAVSGKWGAQQQAYRHPRQYIPANPVTDGFDDGAPLVIAKLQLRGTGRNLQIKFSAGAGKDSWLAGWKIYYDKRRA